MYFFSPARKEIILFLDQIDDKWVIDQYGTYNALCGTGIHRNEAGILELERSSYSPVNDKFPVFTSSYLNRKEEKYFYSKITKDYFINHNLSFLRKNYNITSNRLKNKFNK